MTHVFSVVMQNPNGPNVHVFFNVLFVFFCFCEVVFLSQKFWCTTKWAYRYFSWGTSCTNKECITLLPQVWWLIITGTVPLLISFNALSNPSLGVELWKYLQLNIQNIWSSPTLPELAIYVGLEQNATLT